MRRFFFLICLSVLSSEFASAGNVTARVSGGQLFVYGDSGDNTVTIESFQPGEIQVIGSPSPNGEMTMVNGQAGSVMTFTGWTGGVFCYMQAGSDSVSLPFAAIRGPAHFDLGEGNDDLIIGSLPMIPESALTEGAQAINAIVDFQSSLFVIGANGDDYVSLVNSKVKYGTTFDLGDGADELLVGDNSFAGTMVEFQSNCNVYPGSGIDSVHFAASVMRRSFLFDDSTSNLDLSLQGVTIGENALIFGTSAKDSILLDNVTVVRLLQIFSEQDEDSVRLISTKCETLEVFAGSGVDQVELTSITAKTVRAFLDSGADTLNVTLGNFQKMFFYGGSENDLFNVSTTNAIELHLFGDGGTDTLLRSANSIGTTRLYSVENQ